MGIHTVLLQKKEGVIEGQSFVTVSFLTLKDNHKAEAIGKIMKTFKDYDFLQVSKMQIGNFFRFLL